MKMIILHPSGQREERELPADSSERLEALQAAVGGDIEYLSPAFHGLHNHEVIVNDDAFELLPLNTTGSLAIGMDLEVADPLSGPIVLVPTDEDLQARRERQAHFFGRLNAVVLGLSSEEEAGLGVVQGAGS